MTPNSNWVTTDLLGRHNLHEDHYRSEAVITKLLSNVIIMRTIQYGNWRKKGNFASCHDNSPTSQGKTILSSSIRDKARYYFAGPPKSATYLFGKIILRKRGYGVLLYSATCFDSYSCLRGITIHFVTHTPIQHPTFCSEAHQPIPMAFILPLTKYIGN